MKRIWRRTGLALGLLIIVGAGLWWATAAGWLGQEHDAGVIHGKRLPPVMILARDTAVSSVRPVSHDKQILFGDLHVHTTFSTDAYQFALPFNGMKGYAPVADACDFARFCSALDFWAITDHAEASTPARWEETKRAMRQCQAVAGNGPDPDLVSFIGFEWTQVGRTPFDHWGHKNVIFRDLDDAHLSARPIASAGLTTTTLRTSAIGLKPGILLEDAAHADVYLDFNTFLRKVREVPDCDATLTSNKLPKNCFEEAATPAELVRRLGEQGVNPIIIPHGSTWGFYTPPGTSWDKALDAKEHPERFGLIEIYSGHGNSEEYRPWHDIIQGSNKAGQLVGICPQPTATYTPSCWRAGEIIHERCLKSGATPKACDAHAEEARRYYANMGVAGHLAIKGETPEDWLDAGQCTDCFLPSFNFRPRTSVQYGLAIARFDANGTATRFRWGFIGSSDNHRARPGTGYKEVDRHYNTEAGGVTSPRWRRLIMGPDQPKEARATLIPQDKLAQMAGFQLTEFERQTSFFLTGGIAAVHAADRSRGAIWDALQRREVYATSGPRIMLWFDKVDGAKPVAMGGSEETTAAPTFEVKAVGAFKQKPGCPVFDAQGMDKDRLKTLCSGECFNPSDIRSLITRIEVVRIRPQMRAGEPVDGLIEDKFLVHDCKPDPNGCSFRFSDPSYTAGKRDTIYYVRAIQEAQPTINANPLQCTKNAAGKCVKVKLCYGDWRGGKGDCLAPAEPRAWSSPIYLDWPKAKRG